MLLTKRFAQPCKLPHKSFSRALTQHCQSMDDETLPSSVCIGRLLRAVCRRGARYPCCAGRTVAGWRETGVDQRRQCDRGCQRRRNCDMGHDRRAGNGSRHRSDGPCDHHRTAGFRLAEPWGGHRYREPVGTVLRAAEFRHARCRCSFGSGVGIHDKPGCVRRENQAGGRSGLWRSGNAADQCRRAAQTQSGWRGHRGTGRGGRQRVRIIR